MKCLSVLTFLSLAEAEQVVLGVDVIGHRDAGKAGSVSMEKLLLLPLYVVELDLALDAAVVLSLVESYQEEPFSRFVGTEVDDLAGLELGLLVKDLLRLTLVNVQAVDGRLTNDAELILTDPSPEADLLRDLALRDLGVGVQVEDLDLGDVLILLRWCSGYEHLSRPMHDPIVFK